MTTASGDIPGCATHEAVGIGGFDVPGDVAGTAASWLRPRRSTRVETHRDTLSFAAAVLKDPQRWTYFSLSTVGLFVWDRLDGENTIGQIVSSAQATFAGLHAASVLAILGQLRAAGFLSLDGVEPTAPIRKSWRRHWQHPLLWDCHFVTGVDSFCARLHNWVGRPLFSRWTVTIAALIALGGLGVLGVRGAHALPVCAPALLPWVLLLDLLALLLHESMHALAVKHFGRHVGGAGVGWFWLGPSMSVDTSDMWLGTRRGRIAVSAAGPAADFGIAGTAVVLACFIPDPALSSAMLLFGIVRYLGAFVNLCPLLQYDGYHILMEMLQQPNLKRRAAQWLARRVRTVRAARPAHGTGARGDTAPLAPDARRRERAIGIYCVASLLYVLAISTIGTRWTYLAAVAFVQPILPAGYVHWTASASAGVFVAAVLFGVYKDFFPNLSRRAP